MHPANQCVAEKAYHDQELISTVLVDTTQPNGRLTWSINCERHKEAEDVLHLGEGIQLT